MQTSEKTSNIYAKLFALQEAVPAIPASSQNSHFKNHYASIDAIMAVVRPALQAARLLLVQAPMESEPDRLNLESTLYDLDSGEWIRCVLTLPLEKINPQGGGSALTYSSRYSMVLLGIIIDKDDDGNRASGIGGGTAKATASTSQANRGNSNANQQPSIDDLLGE